MNYFGIGLIGIAQEPRYYWIRNDSKQTKGRVTGETAKIGDNGGFVVNATTGNPI